MKKGILFFAILACATAFAADPVMKGTFEMTPAMIHTPPIKGKAQVFVTAGAVDSVVFDLDAAISSQTSFVSEVQKNFAVTKSGAVVQQTFAWKFKGAPHKWHYVMVLNPGTVASDGTGCNWEGPIYKGPREMTEIETLAIAGIDVTANPPTGWKNKGKACLVNLP